MKILAVYRHYWPDTTPYARLLKSILERLVESGHEVTVVTAQPSYNDHRQEKQAAREKVGGVNIYRVGLPPNSKRFLPAQALAFAWFLLRSVTHAVFFRRYDLVIANGHPPVAIGVALRLIKRVTGASYVLHLQDLQPEALAIVGRVRRGWFYRLLMRIETINCRSADRLVTLSDDMLRQLERRGLETRHTRVINNCPLDEPQSFNSPIAELPSAIAEATGPVLLFAGNLGAYQALPTLLMAFLKVPVHHQARLVFMGAGSMAASLRQLAGTAVGKRVFFVPQQPLATAQAAMRASDLSIVSLEPRMTNVAYPSKALTALAAGCPLFALVDSESNLAETIRRHDLGIVSSDPTPDGVAASLLASIQRFSDISQTERKRIARVAESLFGREQMLSAWDDLISDLVPQQAPCLPSQNAA